MKLCLLSCTLVFLLCNFSISQQVQNFRQGLQTTNSSQSQSYSDDWYNQAIENLQSLERDFHQQQDGSFRAANSVSRITFHLTKNGYRVSNIPGNEEAEKWFVAFNINGIAREKNQVHQPSTFKAIKTIGKIVYQSGMADVEYLNGVAGLRQNFIVHNKQKGKGELRVIIDIATDLQPTLQENKLLFYNHANELKLSYSDLNVWDATKKILPARMEFNKNNHRLELVVDDKNAAYPITIDPINQAPEWNSTVDGLLSSLLTNTQMKTALYGFAVTSLGDVNGDSYGDVAISAPGLVDIFSGTGTMAAVGAVFVYYGSALGLSPTPSKTLQPSTCVAGALFGFSVAGGDVTGDGINDIVVGAPLDKYTVTVPAIIGSSNATVTAGKVYVFQGNSSVATNPSPFLQLKLGNSFFSQGVLGLLSNINVKALLGFSLAVTDDLNGDAVSDIVVGTPSYLGTNILSVQNGSAFVYYSDNLSTTNPVQLQVPAPSLLGLVSLPVVNSSSLLFGYSVDGVGDYNGDGKPDVAVGAPAGVDLSSLGGLFTGQVLGGSAYVYYGTGTGINSSIGAKLHGSSSGLLGSAANLFGFAVKGLRDKNGIHTGNIMIGAPTGGLVPAALSLSIQSGNIQFFRKQSSSPSGNVIATQVIESPKSTSLLQLLNTMQLNVLYGAAIDNAYDINCDGFADLVVGEPLSSGTNISQLQANAVGGSAYIYYGLADGSFNPNPVYDVSTTYGGDVLSVNATALFGFSVAGVPKIQGVSSKPRILVGSPSGALDFSTSLLNLGSTLSTLFNFAAGDNGLGKSYTFNPQLCGSIHTLPARMISFTGTGVDKKVQLNWKTTAEENISEYVIEKSNDGKNFSTLAYVFAKGSTTSNTYDMIDYHPATGTNYYRLRIVATDKQFTYSNVIKVKFDDLASGAILISPNPVINDYKIKLSGLEKGMYTLEIKNTQGQLINRQTIHVSDAEMMINMSKASSMQPGIYSMHIMDNENRQVRLTRFVVK